VVHSNDPQNGKVVLALQGLVKTLIDVRPSTAVSFRGLAEKLSPSTVDLVASAGQVFHITKVESNIEDKVKHELETVEEGKQYRLKLTNKMEQGNYSGFVKLQTDLPQKPDILIRINGFVEGEIRVQPQVVMIGKLGAQQQPRTAKIRISSNREKPFQITKLSFDQTLLNVVSQPVPNEPGFSLEISPRLENVPAGERKQTVVTVETDVKTSEKYEIQVHIMNTSDEASASQQPLSKAGPAQESTVAPAGSPPPEMKPAPKDSDNSKN
jgi:hypothetical protein